MSVRCTLALLVTAALSTACRAAAPRAEPELASSFVPIPNAEFTTQDGRRLHFYDDLVRGRTVVIQFFFTRCQGVCPLSTGKLLALQEALGERLGRDVSFLSITLDPEHDTPAALAQHAQALGARPGWTFLTGAEADIQALRRRLGVFDLDPVLDADRNQHGAVLVLGNDAKQRWSMRPATLSGAFLARAVLRLAEPASP